MTGALGVTADARGPATAAHRGPAVNPVVPSSSVAPAERNPGVRRGGRKRGGLATVLAVVLLLAGGLGALVAFHPGPAHPSLSYVAIYLTDAPADVGDLTLTVAAAYAADRPLTVMERNVPISTLHGPQGAALVAQAALPDGAAGDGFLVLSSVQGVRAGLPITLALARPILAFDGLVAPGGFHRNAVVLDLALDRSVVEADGPAGPAFSFDPQVNALYTLRDSSSEPLGASELGQRLQRSDGGAAHALAASDLPPTVRDRLCRDVGVAALDCNGDAATCENLPASLCAASGGQAARATVAARPSETAGATSTKAAVDAAPDLPSQPRPADASTVLGRRPTVSWSVADPDGDPVEQRVLMGMSPDQLKEICTGSTIRSCDLAPLGGDALPNGGTVYWRVDVRDAQHEFAEGPLWSFVAANAAPPPVTTPRPSDGANFPAGATYLTWDPVDDPDHSGTVLYSTFVSDDVTDTKCDWAPDNSCSVKLVIGHQYHWYVDAKDDIATSTHTKTWIFTAVAPGTP